MICDIYRIIATKHLDAVLVLTAHQAANKSSSCQGEHDVEVLNSSSSEVVVIVLSLLLTIIFISFIVTIACLLTRHQQQLAAVRCEQ